MAKRGIRARARSANKSSRDCRCTLQRVGRPGSPAIGAEITHATSTYKCSYSCVKCVGVGVPGRPCQHLLGSSDKALRAWERGSMCVQTGQAGRPAHTTQSVQTTRADAHAGGAKPGVPVHVSLPSILLCASHSSEPPTVPGSVLRLPWEKLMPVRGNILVPQCAFMHPSLHSETSAHGCQPHTSASRWSNIQTNYPGAAHTMWHETRAAA